MLQKSPGGTQMMKVRDVPKGGFLLPFTFSIHFFPFHFIFESYLDMTQKPKSTRGIQ